MDNLTRTFLCIDMPYSVIKEVARIQEQLNKKIKFIGKSTELENLHVTLKFFGEVDQTMLDKIKERLSQVKFKPLRARLAKSGVFSYKGQPRIIWIKVVGISDIQKQIDSALSDIFTKEHRFMSHLTIARVKYIKDIKYAIEYIKHISVPLIEFEISSIKLKSSILKINGPVYQTIEEYKAKS